MNSLIGRIPLVRRRRRRPPSRTTKALLAVAVWLVVLMVVDVLDIASGYVVHGTIFLGLDAGLFAAVFEMLKRSWRRDQRDD